MIGDKAQSYCCEDISKIYGYKEAIADKENYWDCHHCLGLVWTKEQLIEMGLYYNQPADRLMFVTRSQHKKLHFITGVETRKKMSESRRGQKVAPFTENHRKNISTALKGRTPWNKNKRGAQVAWNKGKINTNGAKKVYQYTKDGEFVKEWKSAADIKRELGYDNSCVTSCCKGKRKTHKGFVWTYKPLY